MLDQIILGSPTIEWLRLVAIWAGVAILLLLVRRLVGRYFGAIAEKTANRVDDAILRLIKGTRSFFLVFVGLNVAVRVVGLEGAAVVWLTRAFFIVLMIQFGLWAGDLIAMASQWYNQRDGEEDAARVTAVKAVAFLAKVLVWSLLLILVLDNFGIDITALVTGLGIGGIAIALAVQNVLGDLLAYVSILVDQPFVEGDFLVVGEMVGTVAHIGIKSTRLSSLSGEQLVFSNSDLLGSRIRNFKRMYERRIVFKVGVEYGTPAETLEVIPGMMRDVISAQTDVRADRVHLKSFDDSAITFEAVYYVTKPDYVAYMDAQQTINLAIYRWFDAHDVAFAFPTQTIHLAKQSGD